MLSICQMKMFKPKTCVKGLKCKRLLLLTLKTCSLVVCLHSGHQRHHSKTLYLKCSQKCYSLKVCYSPLLRSWLPVFPHVWNKVHYISVSCLKEADTLSLSLSLSRSFFSRFDLFTLQSEVPFSACENVWHRDKTGRDNTILCNYSQVLPLLLIYQL